MEEELSNASYEHLVIGAQSLEYDGRGEEKEIDSTKSDLDTHVALGVVDVSNVKIDQSHSKLKVIGGGEGKTTAMNRIDGAHSLHLDQDNMSAKVESHGSGITAVNLITNSQNITQTMNNSKFVVGGSKKPNRSSKPSITSVNHFDQCHGITITGNSHTRSHKKHFSSIIQVTVSYKDMTKIFKLCSKHFPMRSVQYAFDTDNGPAIPITWDKCSNAEMLEVTPVNSIPKVEPGYVQSSYSQR
uniref:uncharacterized protein LOC120335919 isoform X2 n=1 Tax=Styela clava TaxID=7725 RepID=UPI0019394177|nr:uncharacterized protein LOC120335919 isoform X2 [Styela clava]